jgi:3-deoxy-D-manno-octulosonic-acid transferase
VILFFYNLALLLALVIGAPWWLWRMATTRKYREGLAERLGRIRQLEVREGRPLIWVHAVSVGEVLAVSRLVKELDEALPDHFIAVSTTTRTGQQLARGRFGEGRVFYCPLDLPWAVRAHLNALEPKLLVLAETEFWPNLLSACFRRAIPVAVVNARISDRSWPRYRRLRGLWRPFLERLSRVLAQTETDAERLVEIGCDAERVSVAGNLKFDVRATGEAEAARILKALRAGLRLVVAGSTLEGEEAALLEAWPQLLEADPRLVLVLAPRHPERFGAVAEMVEASGYPWNRRTHWQNQPAGAIKLLKPGQIVLLDSIGELASVYSVAAVAFVGGSLVPSGGHNPLEPAQFGVPTVMGPHYANFRAIAEDLRAHDGLRIAESGELAEVLVELLLDRAAAQALGEHARRTFERQAGATERCVKAILELVAEAAPVARISERQVAPAAVERIPSGQELSRPAAAAEPDQTASLPGKQTVPHDFTGAETAKALGPASPVETRPDLPHSAEGFVTRLDFSGAEITVKPSPTLAVKTTPELPYIAEGFVAGHGLIRTEMPAEGRWALAPEERPSSLPIKQTLDSAELQAAQLPEPAVPDESSVPAFPASAKAPAESPSAPQPSEAVSGPAQPQMDPPQAEDLPTVPEVVAPEPVLIPVPEPSLPKEPPPEPPLADPAPEATSAPVPPEKTPDSKTDRPAFSSRKLLTPLTPAYRLGLWMKERRLGSGTGVRRLRHPVVSIGNVSTGGAGKTPLTIALAKALTERGLHVDVLSRGFGRKSEFAARVTAGGSAEEFGDEPLLIAREAGVPVYVAPERFDAGRLAEADAAAIAFLGEREQIKPVMHLLDDGFQHRQLARDVDILLLARQDWEDALLPAGNLREPLSAINRASVVVLPVDDPELEHELRAWGWTGPVWRVQRTMETPPVDGPVLAFCGIARPQQFFAGLTAGGLHIAVSKAFPDHFSYKTADLERLIADARAAGALALVTTEKDLARMGGLTSAFPADLPLKTARLRSQIENQQEAVDWLADRLRIPATHPVL